MCDGNSIETVFNTKEFKIGENTEQQTETFIDIAIYHHTNQKRETVDHKSITSFFSLSISGSVYDTSDGDNSECRLFEEDSISCGQIILSPENFLFDESDYTVSQITKLKEVWNEWHLNDLQPNCCHQIAFPIDDNDWSIKQARETAKCPNGYKYGSAWLVKPLPVKIINFILKFVPKDSIKTDRLEEDHKLKSKLRRY